MTSVQAVSRSRIIGDAFTFRWILTLDGAVAAGSFVTAPHFISIVGNRQGHWSTTARVRLDSTDMADWTCCRGYGARTSESPGEKARKISLPTAVWKEHGRRSLGRAFFPAAKPATLASLWPTQISPTSN